MLLESLLTPVPSKTVATVQVLVNKDSRPLNLEPRLNRAIMYLMSYLNTDSTLQNVHLSSPGPASVPPGYHRVLGAVIRWRLAQNFGARRGPQSSRISASEHG